MMEAVGLVVLALCGLVLAVLAEVRSRKAADSDKSLTELSGEYRTLTRERDEIDREKADIEALLQKSLTERADLAGRLKTAEDLKTSYEEAALLTLARMGAARKILRRPRLTNETRIRKALEALEPKPEPHVTLTTVYPRPRKTRGSARFPR